jgi:hypothetical protein
MGFMLFELVIPPLDEDCPQFTCGLGCCCCCWGWAKDGGGAMLKPEFVPPGGGGREKEELLDVPRGGRVGIEDIVGVLLMPPKAEEP